MRRCAIAAAFLLLLAAAGCGSSSRSSSGGEETGTAGGGGQKVIAGVNANDHGSANVSGETEVEVDDYYFAPTVLEGKPGEKVTLELRNEGEVEHNFTIDSESVDQDLEPGEDAKVTVTIPKSGVVSFYCKYHKSQGMAGGLAVKSGTGGMTGTGGTTTNEDEGNDDNGGYDGY